MTRSILFIVFMCAFVSGIAAQTFNINVVQMLQPQASEITCDSVAPFVLVVNTGNAPSPAFPMVFYIKNPANGKFIFGPITAQVSAVAANGTSEVIFTKKWKPNVPGTYQIYAVSQAGDTHPQDDTLIKGVVVNANFNSRQSAISLVQSEVISISPYKTTLGSYLYLKHSSSDSLLMPGATVSDFDTTFTDTIANPTYFFFLDNLPMDYYYHPVTYVYVDACTGEAHTRDAETPPVINGDVSRFDNDEENFVSGARCNRGVLLPSTTLANTTDTTEWAIIIPGPPLSRKGPWDSTAIPNDIERAKGYLNGDGTGPQVNGGNIIVTNSPGEIGSTMQDICNAITAIQGRNCTKVYLYYIGHGYDGGMVLRNPNGKGTSKFSYHDLACKLLNAGIQNVCIVIMACHSGSAISAMQNKDVRTDDGKHLRLKGVIVVSSTAGNTTTGDSTGSPFMNAMSVCGKDPNADQNRDGKVSLIEAWVWAQLKSDTARNDGASCSQLDSGKITHIEPPRATSFAAGDGGGAVTFELVKIFYPPIIVNKKKVTVCRVFLYVSNPTNNDHHAPNRLTIVCIDAKGKETELIPPATYDLPKGSRICLRELPADCQSVRADKVNGRHVPEMQPTSFLSEARTIIQTHGEFLRERFSIPNDSGASYTTRIVSSPGSWGVGIEPSRFMVFDTTGESIFAVTGLIPDTAKSGGNILASIVSKSSGDTLLYPIRVLVFDSLHKPHELNGRFDYDWVSFDTSSFQTLAADSIFLSNSVLEFAPSDSLMNVNAHFKGYSLLDGSHFAGPQYSQYSIFFDGPFDWHNSSAAQPNEIRLGNSNSFVTIEGGAIYGAVRGLALYGDQIKHSFNTLLIDAPQQTGIYCNHATNCLLNGIRIESSIGKDITLDSNCHVTMLDSYFNPAKIQLTGTDSIARAWTTVLVFSDTAGNPLGGIPIEIKSFNGLIDEKDTSNAVGFVTTRLAEFVWIGGALHLDVSHDTISFKYNGKDSVFSYTANDLRIIEIVLPPAKNSVPQVPASIFHATVHPNPAGNTTNLNFSVSAEERVTIKLYDLLGKEISRVFDGILPAGEKEIALDLTALSSGIYFFEIQAGNISEKGRIVKG